jgi:hypothetical protein
MSIALKISVKNYELLSHDEFVYPNRNLFNSQKAKKRGGKNLEG